MNKKITKIIKCSVKIFRRNETESLSKYIFVLQRKAEIGKVEKRVPGTQSWSE